MTAKQKQLLEAIIDYHEGHITSNELEDILQGLSILEVVELDL